MVTAVPAAVAAADHDDDGGKRFSLVACGTRPALSLSTCKYLMSFKYFSRLMNTRIYRLLPFKVIGEEKVPLFST